MRARSVGVLLTSFVMLLGCERGEPENTVGERPGEPPRPTTPVSLRALTAPPGAILRFPGRGYKAEVVEENKLVVGIDSSVPAYHIEALDGGFMEFVKPLEEGARTADVYVRPLSRYRVSIIGEGCGASLVLRSKPASKVTDIDSLECIKGGVGERISTNSGAGSPLLNFDLSPSREQLALHDGEHLFLIDATSSTELPLISGGGVRPRFAGDILLYRGPRGMQAYDVRQGKELDGEVPFFDPGTLLVARDAPVAFGGGSAFTWRDGTLEVLWSGDVRFPTVSKISAAGNKIAYSTGERFIVEGITDEPFETYYQIENGLGEIFFTRDGEYEVFFQAGTVYHRRDTISVGVRAVTSSGDSQLLFAASNGDFMIYDFETEERISIREELQIEQRITKAQAVPGVMFARTERATYVIDADNKTVAHELEGGWRPFELGDGRLLLVGSWDLEPLPLVIRDYPVCGDPANPCSMILLNEDLSIAWSSDEITGGVPLGQDFSSGFVATSRRLNDGCTPAKFKGKDGVESDLPGDVCHVQRMPDRFFQAPCMPFTVTDGLNKGVYCAR